MRTNAYRAQPPVNWDDFRVFLEVARTGKVTSAGRNLGLDYTTVSRRIRSLEQALGIVLFSKSKARGYELTSDGERLLAHAESMAGAAEALRNDALAESHVLRGQVRIGTTEGFGNFFLAPQLARFQRRHRELRIDLLPVPRFVSLSKREADIAITIEHPKGGPYVCTRLSEYHLRLYATREYLDGHPPIRTPADLPGHDFIGYVDELLFSTELLYMSRIAPSERIVFRSTSVIAQYTASLQGAALAVLPCFLAAQDARLLPVLEDDVVVTKSFWIYCHEDHRRLRRVQVIWDHVRAAAEANRAFLHGETREMVLV
ncbi:MAG TPA: LysR family transcriptional regulator [Anaeromyxobacteraceae bacterium]|nr:LysR family transcriptional regulator [Anaeromyxobacteraceae bacterium]